MNSNENPQGQPQAQAQAQPRFRTPESNSNSIEPAGMGVRFVANLLDGVILAIGLFPITFLFGRLQGPKPSLSLTLVNQLVFMTLSGLYFAYFYSKKGASPGKSVMKLRIVDFKTGGNPDFKSAFIRDSIGKMLSTIVFFGGFLMVLFRKDKRAMHDLIADTQVIRVK